MSDRRFPLDWLVLPLFGTILVIALWQVSCLTWAQGLPTPLKTWEMSKIYVVEPFAKRGEALRCVITRPLCRSMNRARRPSFISRT